MTRGCDLPEDLRMVGCVFSDREERCLDAVACEGGEHRRRVVGPRTIIEGQHHLTGLEKVVALEVLEAEAGTTGGVNLNGAGQPEGVRIARAGYRRRHCSWRHRTGS